MQIGATPHSGTRRNATPQRNTAQCNAYNVTQPPSAAMVLDSREGKWREQLDKYVFWPVWLLVCIMYECMHTWMHICLFVCLYDYVCISAFMSKLVFMSVFIYVTRHCVSVSLYVRICLEVGMSVCQYICKTVLFTGVSIFPYVSAYVCLSTLPLYL